MGEKPKKDVKKKPALSAKEKKVAKAEKKKVEHTIRTVGTITSDQTKEAHVHTKINGWVEQIYADYIGKPVKKGQSLFELYSPDLVSTQEEYLAARSVALEPLSFTNKALDRPIPVLRWTT